jgi:hypothetical protein
MIREAIISQSKKNRRRDLKSIYQSNLYYRLNYSNNLEVEVLLYKNWAVLYTQRLQVQPIGVLFSNLSGAIVGILGLFGFFMGLFEGNYIDYKKKKSNLLEIRNVRENREGIFFKNFIENQLERYHMRSLIGSEKQQPSSDDRTSPGYKHPRSDSDEGYDSSIMNEPSIFKIST